MNTAPRRVLLALTAAVLLVHLGLLHYASQAARQPGSGALAPLVTRTIPPPPSQPTPAVIAAPVPAPPSPRRPAAPQPRTQPRPAATPEPTPSLAAAAASTQPLTGPLADNGSTEVSNQAVANAPSADAAAPTPQAGASAPQATASAPVAVASASQSAASAAADEQRRLLATRYQAPASARLDYDVQAENKGQPYSGRAELQWQQDGQSYSARLEIKAFFITLRTQTSSGRISAHALAPTRFSDKSRSELAAHFRDDPARVTFSANTPEVPLRPMAQDRLSIFLQLAGMLAAEPAKYPPGTQISMQTVGPRSAEDWDFTVETEEPLNLVGGRVLGLKLVHAPALDFDQRVELWFAPTRGYLPVRIRITQADGSFVDMQWRADGNP